MGRVSPFDNDVANFNWRTYAAMIQEDPQRARRGFVRFVLAVMALSVVWGALLASLVWWLA